MPEKVKVEVLLLQICHFGLNVLFRGEYNKYVRYNISNFFGMEAGSKSLRFSDDEKSLGDVEAPRPSLNISNLEDLGERFDEVNSEVNIQVKYYQEFKKIYLTSFKLWTELRKQIKIKEGLTSRVGSIEVS